MKIKLPNSAQNWLSVVGAVVALVALAMIAFLFVLSVVFNAGGSYLGLIVYILLPSVMVAGLLMIPIGMILTIRRRRTDKDTPQPGWPRIDLNDPRHRNATMIFVVGTVIFLFISAIGSYEAFHYTESVEFCGTLCHSVMQPEYVAYQHSAHARVACVECHVGSGADWYIKSKMSGMYQVYSVTFNKYQRPIPTPIENLRPARETCEHCHWPQKFYANKLRLERHYMSDEENTQFDYRLTMRIGSEHIAHGLKEGIHWHINQNVKVEYIAGDEKIETIPWVRLTDKLTGEVKTYMDEENPLSEEEIAAAELHTMDCMDCHNRPSHNYDPPALFVNEAITAGTIPQDLPDIKTLAMDLSNADYATADSANLGIRRGIIEYYTDNYPEVAEAQPEKIEQAIAGLQEAFGQNIFPEMGVRWNKYPNNIGHLFFTGCFRCHNDRHATEEGEFIRKDCNLCHEISAQGTPAELEVAHVGEALEFRHPTDIDEEWKETLCSDCHAE